MFIAVRVCIFCQAVSAHVSVLLNTGTTGLDNNEFPTKLQTSKINSKRMRWTTCQCNNTVLSHLQFLGISDVYVGDWMTPRELCISCETILIIRNKLMLYQREERRRKQRTRRRWRRRRRQRREGGGGVSVREVMTSQYLCTHVHISSNSLHPSFITSALPPTLLPSTMPPIPLNDGGKEEVLPLEG